jgi:hypothetical protein
MEATTAVREAEVTAQRRMIERVQERFGLWPDRLAADAGYGDAPNLAWLVHERDIHPHIPVFDKSARRDSTFERSAFTYDTHDDSYVCPGGKRLRPRNRNFATPRNGVDQDGFIRYRARQHDCIGCDLRQRCTPNMPARKIIRSIHEGARDLARDIATSDAYVTSRRQRKKVENAICAPQAHPEVRPTTLARSERRQGRVPPRRHSLEPAQARQAHPDANAAAAGMSAARLISPLRCHRDRTKRRLLQHNHPKCVR